MKVTKPKPSTETERAEDHDLSLASPSDGCAKKRRKRKSSKKKGGCKKAKENNTPKELKKLIAELMKQKCEKKQELQKVTACLDKQICILTRRMDLLKKARKKQNKGKSCPKKGRKAKKSKCGSVGKK